MSITRAHLPNPVAGTMEMMELHVGVVLKPKADPAKLDDAERVVAVMLQDADKLITEEKFGALLNDWGAVFEVIQCLMDQGTLAFGLPSLKPPPGTSVAMARERLSIRRAERGNRSR